jgi:phosphatidate phosphatase PAH1
LRDLYMSVRADRSGARFLAYVAPAGTRLVVSDIDGTLTGSEAAFIKAVFYGAKVSAQAGAAEALRAANASGAQVVYVTARGDRFTDETRHWLGTHGFPRGPIRLAPSLIVKPGAATVAYKRSVLAGLAGFSIAAGVGNRASDVSAYTDAGVPASKIFVKTSEYRGELSKALRSGAAVGFGAYSRIPLD